MGESQSTTFSFFGHWVTLIDILQKSSNAFNAPNKVDL